jgi:regulatory protein
VPTITRLEIQRKRKDRVNVYLDDEYAFSLTLDIASGLRKGEVLDEAAVAALRGEDGYRVALGRALRYLSYRARTRVEIERKLVETGCDAADIPRVLARLDALGLIDDVGLAERWVEQQVDHRPQGARALGYKLRQRGVPDAAIAEATQAVDEEALALRAALDRASRYRGLDRAVFERRLGAYLARRGFASGAVRAAVTAAWAQQAETE